MVTVEQIKAQYPEPVASERSAPACYCVGGAFLLCRRYSTAPALNTVSFLTRFPEPDVLARSLHAENRRLDAVAAFTFAEAIIDLNDEGNFEQAWGLLENAINYKGAY